MRLDLRVGIDVLMLRALEEFLRDDPVLIRPFSVGRSRSKCIFGFRPRLDRFIRVVRSAVILDTSGLLSSVFQEATSHVDVRHNALWCNDQMRLILSL